MFCFNYFLVTLPTFLINFKQYSYWYAATQERT